MSASLAYPFPGDSTAPDTGAPQSFFRRINDAAIRWSLGAYAQASRPKLLAPVAVGAPSEIVFQYLAPDPGALATTYIRRTTDSSAGDFGPRCPLHGTVPSTLQQAQIRVRVLNEWFTQDDPWRAFWESCGLSTTGYTCSKTIDFGGLAAHEIGHALGLRHVEQPSAPSGLGCPTPLLTTGLPTQPTMCQFPPTPHRSEQRTFEVFDRDTLHIHVDRNGGP